MATNLNAKYREHMTPDERALVHVVDALIARERAAIVRLAAAIASQQVALAQGRAALGDLTDLRGIIVHRTQARMRWRKKCATTDRRNK